MESEVLRGTDSIPLVVVGRFFTDDCVIAYDLFETQILTLTRRIQWKDCTYFPVYTNVCFKDSCCDKDSLMGRVVLILL